MKNRYSLFKKGYWEAGVLLGLCLLIASCGEKEFTTDMPENKLITAISLEVSSELPVQLGTDTTIVYHITPENADHTELKWTTTNELVATVSQDGTISAKSLGKNDDYRNSIGRIWNSIHCTDYRGNSDSGSNQDYRDSVYKH